MSLTTGKHARRVLTKKADAVHSLHNLLVKTGSDADHIAINTVGASPLGVCVDAPDVAEYPAAVELITGPDTSIGVAGAAIAVGENLYPMAAGKIGNAATVGNGATYRIGRALTAAAAEDEEFEFEGHAPIAETIAL